MFRVTIILSVILVILLPGCANSQNPGVSGPVTNPGHDSTSALSSPQPGSIPYILGLWDVYIDPGSESMDIVPLRGADFTLNITKFIDGPPVNLLIKNLVILHDGDFTTVSLDFGFRHPVPEDPVLTIFDVCGVFIFPPPYNYPGPGDLLVSGVDAPKMLNPDGFTRWLNPSEFADYITESPVFGYHPGAIGTPGISPANHLNPYKYFADGLDETGDAYEFLTNNLVLRGSIGPGNENYRRYEVRFHKDAPIEFQYTFIAHWELNSSYPDPPPALNDFPLEANSVEALVSRIDDSSTVYYDGYGDFGGNFILDISLFDWTAFCEPGNQMEEYEINLYSNVWDGAFEVDMVPIGVGTCHFTYRADFPAEHVYSKADIPIWIEVVYPGTDYTNPLGIENLAIGPIKSYFLTWIPVSCSEDGWARTWGGPGRNECLGLAVDAEGNSFITGYYAKTTDFNPGHLIEEYTSNGQWDIFLSKFDIHGNLEWVRTLGGIYSDVGNSVALDDYGFCYVTGYFQDSVDFDPGDGVEIHTAVEGGTEVFVSKYDTSGNYCWTRIWGAKFDDSGIDLCVDETGKLYITGNFSGTVDFDPGSGTDNHSSVGHQDIFLSTLDSDGLYNGAVTWGGTTISGDNPASVVLDGLGHCYVTGNFLGTVDFYPGLETDERTSMGDSDIFLSKFTTDGSYIGVLTWGGEGADGGTDVEFDALGNCYISGAYSQTIDFDPGPEVDDHTVAGSTDAFIIKFDPYGNYMGAIDWGGV